jgi:hypothetical protein
MKTNLLWTSRKHPIIDVTHARIKGRNVFCKITRINLRTRTLTIQEKPNVWNTVDFSFVEEWK